MKNRRVLFFHNTAAEYRIPLFQELTRLYPVTFVFTRIDLAKKIYGNDLDNDKMQKVRYIHFKRGISGFAQIWELISDNDVEGVVVPSLDSIIEIIYAYWILICAKLKGKKVFFYWEKWEAPVKFQPLKRRIKNLFHRCISYPVIHSADFCLGGGNKACEYFINNGGSKEKCDVTYNTSASPVCELTDWKEAYHIPHDKIICLYFGRIVEIKGIKYLLDAITLLPQNIRDRIWLVVAGDGPMRETYQDECSMKGIHNISWIGRIDADRRFDYFSQIDIFILPSYYYKGQVDVWGLTINEAIQCHKVCLATEAVGAAYDIITPENGVILEQGSAKAIADGIVDIINKDLIHRAYDADERILKKYNYNNSAKTFIRHFEDVLADK